MIRGLNKIVDLSGLAYVMSTYTQHPKGYKAAYNDAVEIAADMMASGVVAFVPIAYGPPIEPLITGYPDDEKYVKSHEFWMPICERFYSRSDYGILAMTPGWEKSEGIAVELYAMMRAEKPIYFYDPEAKHIYTMAEGRRKFGEEIAALVRLSIETKQGLSLHEITGNYTKNMREAVDAMVLQGVVDKLGSAFASAIGEEKPSVN